MVVVGEVDACGTVLALADAVVDVFGARWPDPAVQALAGERAGSVLAPGGVYARPVVRRWIRLALVHVCGTENERNDRRADSRRAQRTLTHLADVSGPLGRTFTPKPADEVDACAAVLAGSARAFVYICARIRMVD